MHRARCTFTAPNLARRALHDSNATHTHYEWPAPQHDRDEITVDRIRDDIDGPSHRFRIVRGDTVEVYFAQNRFATGQVTGISHARSEVRVSFREGSDGQWFAVGAIYPTTDVTWPHSPSLHDEPPLNQAKPPPFSRSRNGDTVQRDLFD